MTRRSAAPLALAFTLAAAAAAADAPRADIAGVQRCVAAAMAQDRRPQGCVDAAHAPCLRVPAETPAVASLCFARARDDWSAAIAARMQALRAEAPEDMAARAGIEVKYDLLAALVQCDRMEAIARLRAAPAERVQLHKTRCTATASGLACIRLLWRLPDPDTAKETRP